MKRFPLAFAVALLSTQALAQSQFPANTLWGNTTASTALPKTVTVPNCPTGALNYTAGVGIGCTLGAGSTLAHTHMYVGNASNGAADFGATVTFADTGGATLAPTSGDALTINTAARTLAKGFNITQSGPITGASGTDVFYNNITTSDGANIIGGNLSTAAVGVILTVSNSNAKGQKRAIWVQGVLTTAGMNTGGDIIGASGWAEADFPNGGTDTSTNAKGTLFGFEGVGHAFGPHTGAPGATNYSVISGMELDAIIDTGASSRHRWGINLSGNGPLRGAQSDAAIQIGSPTGTGAFNTAILLSNANGFAPLPTTGCVICVDLDLASSGSPGAFSIAKGIDLSSLTSMSGNFLASPASKFVVSGAGAVTAQGLTLANITGTTQCLHVSTAGLVTGTGTDCGSGGGGAVSSVSNSDSTLTVSPTTGAVVASLNLAHANTWTAAQNINFNTGTTSPPTSGTVLQLIGPNTSNVAMAMDAFGGVSVIFGRRANGTLAAPTAIAGTDSIFLINATAWDGAAYGNAGSMTFASMENWDGTHHGSRLSLLTVPKASTVQAEAVRVQPSGGMSVGSGNVATDPGIGNILATGLTLSGITGAIRCLHVDATGVVSGTSGDCGTGGGGGITSIASSGTTLLVTGTTAVNVDLNLAHANTWTATQTLSGLTLSGVTGAGFQCLHASATGVVSGAANDCSVSPVNLAGGSTVVTGVLPVANGGTGDGGTGWTSYTPGAVTASAGTITTASASGFYKQIGKTVAFRLTITITANGTGSGVLMVANALPVAPNVSSFPPFLAGNLNNSQMGWGYTQSVGSQSIYVIAYNAAYPLPPGITTGTILINGTFEAN